MNTSNIKRYAPKARTAFIAAMTKRAALFGIRESSIPSVGIEPLEQKGDLALIGDRPFPVSIIRPRAALVKKVEQIGFAQAMEQSAYSWFNRLCAIRYMELKGYLDHGRRVLSHPERTGSFQILDDCLDIELEGMDRQRIAELKLDGTKDEELYRELLLTQCHALQKSMPFLFEAVDDATELLLPDNLTKTDSLIRELVEAIPEEDWKEVEIIGWLYQHYISEKKDQVIGKVVKSEDIPAATQLFTPNWIVQYLVQNSVGRQWLQTYPDSPLKAKMPYYIEPAEQAPEVRTQLAVITPNSIDPLTIKVLDPACGSGHILVEAYKILKDIYAERGHRSRDIPQLILENNLFGLDIDDRAGQLACFALMMLAREDDRRIFDREIKLNVLSLQETSRLDFTALWKSLNLTSDWQRGQSQSLFDSEQSDLSTAQEDNRYQLLQRTLARFTQAKNFGSLIDVPAEDAEPLDELLEQLQQLAKEGDSMQKPAAQQLIPYVQQAWILALRFDAVVANPPYMSSRSFNPVLKKWINTEFKFAEKDLFSAFILKMNSLCKDNSYFGVMTSFVWMFISSFEEFRKIIIDNSTIQSLIQLHYDAFADAKAHVMCFTCTKKHVDNFKGCYIRLAEFAGVDNQAPKTLEAIDNRNCGWFFESKTDDFKKIPGSPIAYWFSENATKNCSKLPRLSALSDAKSGMSSCNSDLFLRQWFEVSCISINRDAISHGDTKKSEKKWYPYNKGGGNRRWFGYNDTVINWSNEGRDIKEFVVQNPNDPDTTHWSRRLFNLEYFFRSGLAWSAVTSGRFSCRSVPPGVIPGTGSKTLYDLEGMTESVVFSLLNTNVSSYYLSAFSPTLNFEAGDVVKIPVIESISPEGLQANKLVALSKLDWDTYETSWDFTILPLLHDEHRQWTIKATYQNLRIQWRKMALEVQQLEEENNRVFIEAYELQDELTPKVPLNEITLTCNPHYRYGSNKSEQELEVLLLTDTIRELVSYAIGCMFGRYSMDKPGLILACQGETLRDYLTQIPVPSFPADDDGIMPLTDQEWFTDDATNRFREFVCIVWGDQHLQENLDFVADSLCLYAIKHKRGESALDTIRRYLSTQFYKDHLKTYKKRPIYWLFSSGKHKAFECLVYLHRYNEGTLARMRTEYVIPLTAKLNTYASKLATDIENESVTSEKKRLEKELTTLHNQQAELATFDEKLRHCADQRINLDLDDGVKVNYGKFGDLLHESKLIAGEQPEERS